MLSRRIFAVSIGAAVEDSGNFRCPGLGKKENAGFCGGKENLLLSVHVMCEVLHDSNLSLFSV